MGPLLLSMLFQGSTWYTEKLSCAKYKDYKCVRTKHFYRRSGSLSLHATLLRPECMPLFPGRAAQVLPEDDVASAPAAGVGPVP